MNWVDAYYLEVNPHISHLQCAGTNGVEWHLAIVRFCLLFYILHHFHKNWFSNIIIETKGIAGPLEYFFSNWSNSIRFCGMILGRNIDVLNKMESDSKWHRFLVVLQHYEQYEHKDVATGGTRILKVAFASFFNANNLRWPLNWNCATLLSTWLNIYFCNSLKQVIFAGFTLPIILYTLNKKRILVEALKNIDFKRILL